MACNSSTEILIIFECRPEMVNMLSTCFGSAARHQPLKQECGAKVAANNSNPLKNMHLSRENAVGTCCERQGSCSLYICRHRTKQLFTFTFSYILHTTLPSEMMNIALRQWRSGVRFRNPRTRTAGSLFKLRAECEYLCRVEYVASIREGALLTVNVRLMGRDELQMGLRGH